MHDEVSTRAPQIAEFSHVAYCSGPFQLAILLSALDVCGVPRANCTVMPFQGSARNDELKRTLVEACSRLGMETVDPASMPSPTLSDARRLYDPARRDHRVVHWYCQGVPFCRNALHHLLKTLPDIVFEYYDGLGSYIAASEQERKRLALEDAHDIGDIRQLAVQRLMLPERHFMPEGGRWEIYAPPGVQARTQYVPRSAIQEKIGLVGDILDDFDLQPWPEHDGPDVILIMAKLSEIRREVALDQELRMYDDLLRTLREALKGASILAKTHPRSSPEKMHRLQEICTRHSARLYSGQQLAEYFVERSGRHDVAFVGPPSSALLSAIQFRYGRPFCLSQSFMASYIGPDYGGDAWQGMHHQVMEEAGVTTITSLPQLTQALGTLLRTA